MPAKCIILYITLVIAHIYRFSDCMMHEKRVPFGEEISTNIFELLPEAV